MADRYGDVYSQPTQCVNSQTKVATNQNLDTQKTPTSFPSRNQKQTSLLEGTAVKVNSSKTKTTKIMKPNTSEKILTRNDVKQSWDDWEYYQRTRCYDSDGNIVINLEYD